MIVFDLRCSGDHVFEAWFGSTDDYESQRRRGMIACPLCGDADVGKAVMAPAVAAKGNRSAGRPGSTDAAALFAMQRQFEAQSDYVGANFAAVARTRHADADAGPCRPVYGEASDEEARALIADGIPVMPLPFRPLVRSDA